MNAETLSERTKFLEKELGPCILIVKCYEVAGDRLDDAKTVARQISYTELERLNRMTDRGIGFGPVSEQYLRVIYAFDVAGLKPQALVVFRALVEAARRAVGLEGLLGGVRAFRIGVAQVIAGDPMSTLDDLLTSECLGSELIRGWQSGTREALETCVEELEELVEYLENQDQVSPWDDVWYYVVLRRLKIRLDKDLPQS